jgi:hypothetical protein
MVPHLEQKMGAENWEQWNLRRLDVAARVFPLQVQTLCQRHAGRP